MKESSTTNAAQEGNERRGNLIPMRYMIGIVTVLAILVLGIVTPDILQYRAQVAALGSVQLDSKILISVTNAAGKGINTNLTIALNGSNTNVSFTLFGAAGSEVTAHVLLNGLTSLTSASILTNIPPPPTSSPSLMPATANPFEPYARLVTLLLSIVSVLGLFFAYFVRKSLHETEEALERRFDRNMELWKAEQKTVAAQAAQVTSDANEISKKLQEVKELSRQLKEVTDELNQADEKRSQKSAGKAEVAQAMSALDAQLPDPSPAAADPKPPANKP